jgi:hypothetical protein
MYYRARKYQQYSTAVQRVEQVPTLEEMDRWGESYDSYVRRWVGVVADEKP